MCCFWKTQACPLCTCASKASTHSITKLQTTCSHLAVTSCTQGDARVRCAAVSIITDLHGTRAIVANAWLHQRWADTLSQAACSTVQRKRRKPRQAQIAERLRTKRCDRFACTSACWCKLPHMCEGPSSTHAQNMKCSAVKDAHRLIIRSHDAASGTVLGGAV